MSFPYRVLFACVAGLCGGALIAVMLRRAPLGLDATDAHAVWWFGGIFIAAALIALAPAGRGEP